MRLVYILFALMTVCSDVFAEGTWEILFEGMFLCDIEFEEKIIWGATAFNGVIRFDTETGAFQQYNIEDGLLSNSCKSITIDNDGTKWFGHSLGVSSYNGLLWNSHSRDDLKSGGGNYIVADNENNIYAGFTSGVSKYVRDNGTWVNIYAPSSEGKGFIDDNNHLWFGYSGRRMCYNGVSVTEYIDTDQSSLFQYWTGAADQNNIMYWGGREGLRVFQGDEGKTYKIDRNNGISSIAIDSNNGVWIGAYGGLYFFENGVFTPVLLIAGDNAVTENDYELWDFEIANDGTIYFVANRSSNNGILARYIPDEPVGVTTQPAPEIVQIIKAQPNPFNGATMLSFSLPTERIARLTVHDITGRKIRELANGSLPAGMHSYVWDGRDSGGTAVASGVYISRLEAGNVTASGKMVFVK